MNDVINGMPGLERLIQYFSSLYCLKLSSARLLRVKAYLCGRVRESEKNLCSVPVTVSELN